MTKLYLVRHGETEENQRGRLCGWNDPDLSEQGREQARQAAKLLQEVELQALYHSGLKRAHETARIIAGERELELLAQPELRELHFGSFEGMTLQEVGVRFPEEYRKMLTEGDLYHFPEGESLPSFHRRVVPKIDELLLKHQGESVLLVAHGGTLRSIIAHLVAEDAKKHWRFKVFHGSVSLIEGELGFYMLSRLNCLEQL